MKAILLVLLFGLLHFTNAQDGRLIQFNESYTVWMPTEEVEKMASECGLGPTNFMDITDHPHMGEHPNTIIRAIPVEPSHPEVVNPIIQQISQVNIESVVRHLSSYQTRYYTSLTGVEAAQYLAAEYRRYGAGRDDVEVELFQLSWAQPSVIARILGNGPYADELVIIGGHIDSTGSAIAPGADDDASGSSCVLEIFRAIAASGFKPERTIEFHGYAAEEVGLRGSQDIAQRYLSQGKVVEGMLQLDMTGYIRSGTTPTVGVVTDFTNGQLSTFVRALTNAYTSTRFTNTQCGYACSDHGSWHRAGYPAAFTFESIFSNSNPYIHTSNDVMTRLNFAHAREFALLGVGFAVELSFVE